ncbi:nudix hydrolase 13, mitochondrial isoform X1 [Apium graveolens]|uniref:nudix hydrolase 13, mitochondrial isoform X1 n=1 Tax=Apium graveolens TaxID=4045 RepID=UPI003D7A4619
MVSKIPWMVTIQQLIILFQQLSDVIIMRCIPYRVAKNNDEESFDLESSLEVLMISSPNRDDLVFPKGGWEDDETVEEAACREALEEAGVKGIIKGDSLGDWTFRSKSRQESGCLEGGCKVWMFALEVTEELDAWPEQENHDRRWLFIKDAFQLCRYQWMSTALEKFIEIMASEKKHGESQSLVVLHPAQVSDVSNSLVVLNPAPVSEVVTENQIMSTNCLPNLLSQNSTGLESFQCSAQQC